MLYFKAWIRLTDTQIPLHDFLAEKLLWPVENVIYIFSAHIAIVCHTFFLWTKNGVKIPIGITFWSKWCEHLRSNAAWRRFWWKSNLLDMKLRYETERLMMAIHALLLVPSVGFVIRLLKSMICNLNNMHWPRNRASDQPKFTSWAVC